MSEDKIKQVLVVRKDLNMRKGKIAAQCAHASLALFLNHCHRTTDHVYGIDTYGVNIQIIRQWLAGKFYKICVYVNSEQELVDLQVYAQSVGILNYIIEDAGDTEFHGLKTKTVLALGPEYSSVLDKITGHLKLL